MKTHWLLALLGGLLLFWGASLLLMRRWTRRRVLQEIKQENLEEEFAPAIPHSRPEDEQALEVIRTFRRRYLLKLWPATEFSWKLINDMSLELIQEMARVYYPEEERPELRASLADLVALYNRVGERLATYLGTFPIRTFKDLEVGTIVQYHEMYRNLKNHPGYQFIQRHHLDRVARWSWTLYNYANPWHWGRKAAYAGGKEALARMLLARIAQVVGEEAWRLYGRRG
jgi:hypothetical protein